MEKNEMILKCNCSNQVKIEGYARDIKYLTEEINGRQKTSLEFTVMSINTNEDKNAFITPFPVVCYKNRATSVNEFIKEMMLIEVEGRMRITPSGKVIIVAVYVNDATPELRKITLPQEEK